MTRIYFSAGHDAWDFDSAVRDTLVEAAAILEISPPELPGRVTSLAAHTAELEKKLKTLTALWVEGAVRSFRENLEAQTASGQQAVASGFFCTQGQGRRRSFTGTGRV